MKNNFISACHITVSTRFENILINFLATNGLNKLEILKPEPDITQITIYSYDKTNVNIELLLASFKNLLPSIDYLITYSEKKNILWYETWENSFKPIKIGKNFIVIPPWEKIKDTKRQVIIIDAGNAFGTGYHETTQLTLKYLEQLNLENKTVIDIGCGSSILGIASLFLGAQKVEAFDIDIEAIESSKINIELNLKKDKDKINLWCGTPDMIQGNYDVVLANILSKVLIKNRLYIFNAVKPDNGVCIVSGVLWSERVQVKTAFTEIGFVFSGEIEKNGWCSLLMRRKK